MIKPSPDSATHGWMKSNIDAYYQKCTDRYDQNKYINDQNWNSIVNILEDECSEFINELVSSDSSTFFRGARPGKEVSPGISIKNSRVDRSPKDMRQDVSNMLDDFFSDKFGHSLRSNGVFSSKHPLDALTYSDYNNDINARVGFMFFPIGDYSYYWNPKIHDLFSELDQEEWYHDFDILDSGDISHDYLEYDWWRIYGEPNTKLNDYGGYGGGKGKYFYNGIAVKNNIAIQSPSNIQIVDNIRDDSELYGDVKNLTDDEISDKLLWIPQISLDEFERDKVSVLKEEFEQQIHRIVNGYKEGGMGEIKSQEVTFICSKYYLVEDKYLPKLVQYLDSKKGVSKLTDDSHS